MLAWIVVCVPFQLVFILFHLPQRRTLPVFFHRVFTRYIMGMDVRTSGTVCRHVPTLYISNHLSYLDIPAISSVMPVSFVSKAEVAGWPLFGFLAKLQDTVFVERRRSATQKHSKSIAAYLAQGKNLLLFPEGTSTDGHQNVLPFKTGLLQGVSGEDARGIMVQPIAVSCSGTNPDGYPWYGDMTLVEHLWPFFKQHGIIVTITFMPPVKAADFADRKALADYAFQQISRAPHGVI